MSQKPSAVKSSPPFWLWTMLIIATLVIGVGVVLSSIPDDPKTIYESAYNGLKQQSATEGEFTAALSKLRQFPEYSSHVLFLEGALAAAQSRDPKALELFERAAENPELKPMVLQSIGRSRTRMGDFKGGIQAYEESIELSPELADETRVMLARLYYVVGAKKLAEDVLMTVVGNDEKNRDARLQLASICSDLGRHKDAVEHLSQLLSSVGEFSAASPDQIDLYAQSLIKADDQEKLKELSTEYLEFINEPGLKAMVQIAAGKANEVLAEVEGAIANDMANVDTILAYVNVELDKGGRNSRIDDLIGELIQGLPRNLEVWKAAARFYKAEKDADKLAVAESNVQELTKLSENLMAATLQVGDDCEDVEGRVKLMNLLAETGNLQSAMSVYEVIKMLAPATELPPLQELEKKAMSGAIIPFSDPSIDNTTEDKEATKGPTTDGEKTPPEQEAAPEPPR